MGAGGFKLLNVRSITNLLNFSTAGARVAGTTDAVLVPFKAVPGSVKQLRVLFDWWVAQAGFAPDLCYT